MTLHVAPAHRAMSGFTLVELLLAMLLLSMIGTLLIQSLSLGRDAYAKMLAKDNATRDIFQAQETMRRLIEGASLPQAIEGTSSRLTLVGPAPSSMPGAGLVEYQLLLVSGNAGQGDSLVVRWKALSDTDNRAAHADEVLLDDVSRLSFSFQGAALESRAWRESWQGGKEFPALVRIEVERAVAGAMRWPVLLISPRLTRDVGCLFDAVAQDCR